MNDMLHVILVNPEIPPNTGNIARLCGATATPLHLVHPLGFSTSDKALRRAGLDYWKEVAVSHHKSYREALTATGDGPIILFSARAKKSYLDAPYTPGARLVFGPETRGLPPDILDAHPGCAYRIPIWGKVRSLNLSTSVGIAVYEAYRKLGMLEEGGEGTFRDAGALPGKIFQPCACRDKKHPCGDCFSCQWCSDERCRKCRGG